MSRYFLLQANNQRTYNLKPVSSDKALGESIQSCGPGFWCEFFVQNL